jgi:matrixin
MKPIALAASIVSIALLLGCNVVPGNEYEVEVDPSFSASATTAILAGLDDWSSKVPVTFHTIVTPCSGVHDHRICVHASDGATVDQESAAVGLPTGNAGVTRTVHGSGRRGDTGGISGVDGGETWLAIDRINDVPGNFQMVAAHEMGHAMGLVHHLSAQCLMDPGNVSPTVANDDIDQWYFVRYESAPNE